jgi:hypothetical protein
MVSRLAVNSAWHGVLRLAPCSPVSTGGELAKMMTTYPQVLA